jgi:hypothetical protein
MSDGTEQYSRPLRAGSYFLQVQVTTWPESEELAGKLRRVKYLNNVIEQDHRAIRWRWRAMQCFRSFHTAERALEGVEALHMMRKEQVRRLVGRDSIGQAKFIESLFGVASSVSPHRQGPLTALLRSKIILATEPSRPANWASGDRCFHLATKRLSLSHRVII